MADSSAWKVVLYEQIECRRCCLGKRCKNINTALAWLNCTIFGIGSKILLLIVVSVFVYALKMYYCISLKWKGNHSVKSARLRLLLFLTGLVPLFVCHYEHSTVRFVIFITLSLLRSVGCCTATRKKNQSILKACEIVASSTTPS